MIFLIVKATVSCLFNQDTHALDQTHPPHYILPKKYFHPFSPKNPTLVVIFRQKLSKKAILAVDKK